MIISELGNVNQHNKMKGITINSKRLKPNTGSKITDFILYVFLIAIAVVLSPILIVLWLMGLAYKLIMPESKYIKQESNYFIKGLNNENHKFHYIVEEDQPIEIAREQDGKAIIEFVPPIGNEILNGYFTDLLIERDDGVFLQKIVLGNNGQIQEMPVMFVDYEKNEINMIRDLKGYEIYTKGGKNDFMIIAINETEELEIRIKK